MDMNKELMNRVFLFVVIGILVLGFVVAEIDFVGGDPEGTDLDLDDSGLDPEALEILEKITSNTFVKILFGHPSKSVSNFKEAYGDDYDIMPLGDVSAIIIHLVIFVMLFVGLSDIFGGGFLPLKNKYVPWILGGGLTIILANFGVIPGIIIGLAKWTAWAGAASIFVAMLVAIIAFVLVTISGNWLKLTLLKGKRKAAADAGGDKTATAISNLGKIEKSLEESGDS